LYYNNQGLPFKLLVADSSDINHLEKTQSVLRSLEIDIFLHHKIYDKNIKFDEKISDVLNCVDTLYTVFASDDDFFVPSTLKEAISFLENHRDYSVVHGTAVAFNLKNNTAHGDIDDVCNYEQRSIEGHSGIERLLDQFKYFTGTWYSVQRTQQLHDNWKKMNKLQGIGTFNELLMCGLALCKGKAKKLDALYMVRQINTFKENTEQYNLGDSFDWITSPGWSANCKEFCKSLAEELAKSDGIDFEIAKEVVKQAFWMYLNLSLINKYKGKYKQYNIFILRNVLQQTLKNCLDRSLKITTSLIPKWSNKLLTNKTVNRSALMHPSSPYYYAFFPIYNAIANSRSDI
jgi:glycosyltransferase domain-containing protein